MTKAHITLETIQGQIEGLEVPDLGPMLAELRYLNRALTGGDATAPAVGLPTDGLITMLRNYLKSPYDNQPIGQLAAGIAVDIVGVRNALRPASETGSLHEVLSYIAQRAQTTAVQTSNANVALADVVNNTNLTQAGIRNAFQTGNLWDQLEAIRLKLP